MDNNNNNRILPIIPMLVIIILLVLILAVIFFVPKIGQYSPSPKETNPIVAVEIQSSSYKGGENGKVKISNGLDKKICFSSCYPYYLEIEKAGSFESYPYLECEGKDLSGECVYPNDARMFEFPLEMSESGKHRMAIPYCMDCEQGSEFKKENWAYSNEFNFVK